MLGAATKQWRVRMNHNKQSSKTKSPTLFLTIESKSFSPSSFLSYYFFSLPHLD